MKFWYEALWCAEKCLKISYHVSFLKRIIWNLYSLYGTIKRQAMFDFGLKTLLPILSYAPCFLKNTECINLSDLIQSLKKFIHKIGGQSWWDTLSVLSYTLWFAVIFQVSIQYLMFVPSSKSFEIYIQDQRPLKAVQVQFWFDYYYFCLFWSNLPKSINFSSSFQ